MKRFLLTVLFSVMSFSGILYSKAKPDTKPMPAPDFKLQQYKSDKSFTLSGLVEEQKVIIIDFFDTNCKPCIKEIPKLAAVAKKHPDTAKVFLICLDEKPEKVLPAYLKKHKVTLPILLDPLGYRAGERYGVTKYGVAEIPQVFVIGKGGKIRNRYKGYHEDIDTSLAKDIAKLSVEKIVKPKEDFVEIIYTGSSNGYLESCDCPQNPFGGIVRKIHVVNKIKKANPDAIAVDSGDYFPPRADKLLSDYCAKMIKLAKHDMIAIGDQEILCGAEFLKEAAKSIPLHSSNFRTCDDKMCYPFNEKPFIIKQVSDIKVALVSILNPNIFFLFPKDKLKKVEIAKHMEYLKNIIPQIRKEADFLMLVSHCGDDEDKKIANTIPGIDLVVGGHSQTFHKKPVKIKDTLIVQGGQNGHRVGVLKLKFDKDKKLVSYENKFTLLNSDVPDDPEGRKLIDEYKKKLKEKAKQLTK